VLTISKSGSSTSSKSGSSTSVSGQANPARNEHQTTQHPKNRGGKED
jgi:hypothetical protein